MTSNGEPPAESGMAIDFEALYRGQSPAAGVAPLAAPPWDTHGPKENVLDWQARGLVRGDVLDVGCGLGDNAVFLAQSGFAVTGLDFAPTAIGTARARAADAGVAVTFAVADVTVLDGYDGAFDTVIDSGLFHCLSDADKPRYAAAIHRAARPGATLLMSCFSAEAATDVGAGELGRPRPVVSAATLRAVLGAAGWRIVELAPVSVHRDGWGGELNYWHTHAERVS